jgi:hypothetical protein
MSGLAGGKFSEIAMRVNAVIASERVSRRCSAR